MIGRAELADAIHAAVLTESTAAAVPLVIHLAYRNRWLQSAQIAGTPASGVPPLVMTNEIFCSEAWARCDPAHVARQVPPRLRVVAGRRERRESHEPRGRPASRMSGLP